MKKNLLILTAIGLLTQYCFAQQRQITGVITGSDDNTPIIGATVIDKSTGLGEISDENGQFKINVGPNSKVLQFSSLGYVSREITIAGNVMDVVLTADITMLDEVMVVAYGTGKRSTYTGSASVIKKESIDKINTSNITTALQGMSSGLQVVNSSGQPGSGASIIIRGIGSMNASISPLYVVDGTPYSGYINAISPSDIESITVLKDASASALYGSRAANGVIMITTRKGRSDEGQINFRANTSFSELAVDLPRQLTPTEFVETTWLSSYFGYMDNLQNPLSSDNAATLATNNLYNLIKINPFSISKPVGTDGKLSPEADLLYWGDWRGALMKSRPTQEYSIDFSKRNNKTDQFYSLSYLNDKGIFTTQEFDRLTARVSVNSQIKEWLKIGTNTSFAHSETIAPAGDQTVRFLRTVPTIYPIYEWDADKGNYRVDGNGKKIYDYGENRLAWIAWNPLADADYNRNYSQVQNLSSRNYIDITFLPELKFQTTYSYDFWLYSYHGYTTPDYGSMKGRGQVYKQRDMGTTWTLSNILTYNKTFGDNTINALLGQEAYNSKYNYLNATREDLPFGGLYELNAAATMTGSGSYENNYRLLSFLSRFEYDYKSKYSLSASLRSDGSSRFSPESRWGTFWSAGASWLISEEDFLKSVSWINNLKLKVSYGAVGNDGLSTFYAYQGLYAAGYDDYGQPGLMISRLPNNTLKWESNIQFNTGIEFWLFNTLSGSIEYFNRKSKDLLFTMPMPLSTGFSGIDRNIGDVKNYGLELDVNYTPINRKNFTWSINFNATHYKNEITKLPQEEMNAGVFKWEEGKSNYSFWGAEYAGINPDNGNDQWWKNVYEIVDGEKIFKDRVKTENINEVNSEDQKKYIGNAIPDIFGGITNSFSFYGVDFSFMFYYSIGGDLYDSDYSQMMAPRDGFSYHPDVLKAWTPENPNSTITRFSKEYANSIGSYSSKFLYDNTFLRLRNASLGYTLPKSLMDNIGINSLRVYVSGDNLMTWGSAAERGTDPEQSINGTTGNRFPTRKSVSIGIQLNL